MQPSSTSLRGDDSQFLARHFDLLSPAWPRGLSSEVRTTLTVGDGHARLSGVSALDQALRLSRTEVLSFRKADAAPEAKHLLLTASDYAGALVQRPLIEALMHDPRCKRVSLVIDLMARSSLLEAGTLQPFRTITATPELLFTRISALHEECPIDNAMISPSALHGTDRPVVASAKEIFGIAKLFAIVDSWSPPFDWYQESGIDLSLFDGIVCNDALAARLITADTPSLSRNAVQPLGTAQTDSLHGVIDSDELNKKAIQLQIRPDARRVLLLGDRSGAYSAMGMECRPDINERTLHLTAASLVRAGEELDIAIDVLVRPHPGDAQAETLMRELKEKGNARVQFVDASRGRISMDEALALSELTLSIFSTEGFRAPYRGSRGVFLSYGDGLGGAIHAQLLSDSRRQIIETAPGLALIHHPNEIAALLQERAANRIESTVAPPGSTARILDLILA